MIHDVLPHYYPHLRESGLAIWDRSVRKHLTRGFLCAVLDLSGTLWPLLIPEYSGIKRRGTPFPGLRNPSISHYSDKYPLPSYEKVIVCNSLFDRDHLMFYKSGIFIFIFAENNYSIYAHTMLINTPLLHQSFGPHVCLSFFLFFIYFSLYLFLANSLECGGLLSSLSCPGF